MVTGTAHCALGPYWRDPIEGNRTEFLAYQASRRGGFVSVGLQADRVLIGGHATTILLGQLLA
jgi:predicted PhzF superfamily epimerase YddE/YHI9